jgi:hypothetical protein
LLHKAVPATQSIALLAGFQAETRYMQSAARTPFGPKATTARMPKLSKERAAASANGGQRVWLLGVSGSVINNSIRCFDRLAEPIFATRRANGPSGTGSPLG